MRTCTVCGSKRVARKTIEIPLRNAAPVTVKADVCAACGETYLDPAALDAIDRARAAAR